MHVSNIINLPINPRLLVSPLSTSTSPTPSLYNKSKKRWLKTISSDKREGIYNKKVDLRYAISSLLAEIAKGRKL
jgi:hypothetical protein